MGFIALYSGIPKAFIQLKTTLECVKTKYVPKNLKMRTEKIEKPKICLSSSPVQYSSPVVQSSD